MANSHGMEPCRVCGALTSRIDKLCFKHTYSHPHLREKNTGEEQPVAPQPSE